MRLNAKELTIIAVLVLLVTALPVIGIREVWGQVLAAVGAAAATDLLLTRLRFRDWVFPDAAILTGLIVGGVAAPRTAPLVAASLAILAVVSKHLLRVKGKPLFNPAAFALLVGIFLGLKAGWWVDINHGLTVIVGTALLALYRGRWRLVLPFVVALNAAIAALAVLRGLDPASQINVTFGISTFFTFFMLTDPRTSPSWPPMLPWFGVLVAAVSVLSFVFHPPSIFLGGLLLANATVPLLDLWAHRIMARRTASAPAVVPTTSALARER